MELDMNLRVRTKKKIMPMFTVEPPPNYRRGDGIANLGTMRFEYDGTKTVRKIKQELQAPAQIANYTQLIFLKDGAGKCYWFPDSARMESFKAKLLNNAPINLTFHRRIPPPAKNLSILVQLEDKVAGHGELAENIPIEINSDATVLQLMQKIDEEVGVAPYRQTLTVQLQPNLGLHLDIEECSSAGRNCKLDDVLPAGIDQYQVTMKIRRKRVAANMGQLLVSLPFAKEELVSMNMEDDTVSSLRHEIKSLRRNWIRDRATFTLLTELGRELADGTRTLSYYGLKSGDKIYLNKHSNFQPRYK